jgi:DNA-binding MurR/RpiR family transcriptional regulator
MLKYQSLASLNQTDRTIYHYVMTHIDHIDKMKVRELADETYTSSATIVRFYKKLGSSNFETFKKELHLLYDGEHLVDRTSDKEEYKKSEKYFHSDGFTEALNRAVKLIKKADNIHFMGVGNSGILAHYGARYFSNVGYYADAIADPDYPPSLRGGKQQLLIVITQSGETPQAIRFANMYKELGYQVICITNHKDSTIAALSHVAITYNVTTMFLPQNYDLTTSVPVVYIIERMGRELFRLDRSILNYLKEERCG